MDTLTFALALQTGSFDRPMAKSRGLLKEFGGETATVGTRGAAGVAVLTGAITRMLGPLMTAAVAWKGLKASIGGAAAMESNVAALEAMTGSLQTAQDVMKRTADLAAATPFELPELADATRKLIAFGEATGTVDQTLSRVGDVAAGVQAPLSEIAELYGKARVQQTLFSEDINQLTGRGIPIISELAKVIGTSDDQVKKLAEQGKITFPLLDQAFRNLTGQGGKFFGMMQKQSQTTSGLWSTLKDNVSAVFRTLGEPINDALRPLMKEAAADAQRIGDGLAGLIGIMRGAAAQGNLGEIVGLSLKIGFAEAVNAFTGLLIKSAAAVVSTFTQAWDTLKGVFSGEIDVGDAFASFDERMTRIGIAWADMLSDDGLEQNKRRLRELAQAADPAAFERLRAAIAGTSTGGPTKAGDGGPAAGLDDAVKKANATKEAAKKAKASVGDGIDPTAKNRIQTYNREESLVREFNRRQAGRNPFADKVTKPKYVSQGNPEFDRPKVKSAFDQFLEGVKGVRTAGVDLQKARDLAKAGFNEKFTPASERGRRETRRQRAQRLAKEQRPRWDTVEKISDKFEKLGVL